MFLTVCITLSILLALFNHQAVTNKIKVGPNDVSIKAELNYFQSSEEYAKYSGSVANVNDYKNKLRLDVYWDYAERIVEKQVSPPLIIIVPIDNQLSYSGVGHLTSTTVSSSISEEIIDILSSSYPEYNWGKMGEERFGWVLHPNDEGQRHVTISFMKNEIMEQPIINEFKIYFVYFNPKNKEGWAKQVLATL
ncbi:hypothetical protein [Paenibacillus caui]|uniref:hypothetical protein n=1 Tax=Paenibacillus caui TaxID=2873927 RepID=UPI001CA9B352|nr:hypothetical protein [Paenibacillus caui]